MEGGPRRGQRAENAHLAPARQQHRQQGAQHRSRTQPDQHEGPARPQPAQRRSHPERTQPGQQRGRAELRQMLRALHQHAARPQATRHPGIEQITQRVDADQAGRTAGEAQQRRRRDEVRQQPQPQCADRGLDNPDHDRHHQRQLDVAGRAGRHQRRQHRRQRQRVGIGRARHHMPARAGQRRHHGGHQRAVQAVLRRQPRQRRKGDALRQHQQRAQQPGLRIGLERRRRDDAHPGAEQALGQRAGDRGNGRSGHGIRCR